MAKNFPTPKQICDYLWAHGWRESHVLSVGVMFEFERLSDEGRPITVFVADRTDYDDYPLRVSDVIDTVSAIEGRSKEAVRADLLGESATSTAPANGTPPASVPASPAQPIV